ncbi:MAG: ABC transporter permease [Ignavibacteria bacterium]|nr:ABC transporter permease [Ignavibacteria bacterium]
MDMRSVLHIARQELTVNIRNKWTIIFAIIFGLLVVSIAYVGMMVEGFSGMQSFTRTSASILNLVLYIVPLVALTMGTLSFTGDRGAAELLYSQPVSRTEVLLGKLIGVFLSLAISTLLGFVLSGGIIFLQTGSQGIVSYGLFVALTLGLSLTFLSLAALVSVASGRKSKAFGLSLFVWFFFVLFYDLLTLGGTLLFRGRPANTFLFVSLFGNPVDMVRVASLIILDDVTIFGASGAALLRFLGGSTLGVVLLVGGLTAWIILPLRISRRVLERQDI